MKQKKLIIGLAVCLVAVIAVVGIILVTARPETQDGTKVITVEIVYSDTSNKVFEINTDAEFLADALFEEKIVTQEEYTSGFYTVIDGEKADYNENQSWWCVTKGGEMTTVGMNELPITDGDKFEITYTIG